MGPGSAVGAVGPSALRASAIVFKLGSTFNPRPRVLPVEAALRLLARTGPI